MPIETQRTRTHQLEDSKEAVISGPANPAADPRQIRRVIAEDPEWNLETVPPLCDLCVSHIVSQFQNNPLLDELPHPYRQKVLDKLPTSIPLDVTAPLINEEDYWEKCCNERWALCVVADHNGKWKQMYFERHIQEMIEQFVPSLSDLQQLESSLKLASPYVQCIKLNQLLPPPPPQEIKLLDEEEMGDNLSEVDSLKPNHTHLDLGVPLKHLEKLQELHLSYGVKNCGMNFEWGLFEFTKEDCQKLATAIKSTHQLKVLSLYRSKLSDDKARLLISYLLDHTSLSTLDLSHNKLSDGSARALSKLLNGHCVLCVLDISNNCIGAMGGASLGHALKVNNTLIELNIKLNRLGDEGAQPILKALMKNTTLQSLNIGSNDFGEPTATILSELLVSNQILTKLNITCNKLGETGGKLLQEGIEENNTLIELDLRLTEISAENEYSINQKIRTNADRVGGVS